MDEGTPKISGPDVRNTGQIVADIAVVVALSESGYPEPSAEDAP
jgi:hypothetical protein